MFLSLLMDHFIYALLENNMHAKISSCSCSGQYPNSIICNIPSTDQTFESNLRRIFSIKKKKLNFHQDASFNICYNLCSFVTMGNRR